MRRLANALTLLTALLAPFRSSAAETARAGAASMARIPSGWYRPLYATPQAPRVRVNAFSIDRFPVTRGDYLMFVRQHPEWARGAVRPVFAEHGYLADWAGASIAGVASDLQRPVVNVSWFAARAYCSAADKRLPTVDEWERVASASATQRNATGNHAHRRDLLERYASRLPGTPRRIGGSPANAYGVSDLHGLVWEWTLDFNSVIVADDSRTTGTTSDARDHRLFCASAAIGAVDPGDYPAFARYAVRASLTARSTVGGVGFRCAR